MIRTQPSRLKEVAYPSRKITGTSITQVKMRAVYQEFYWQTTTSFADSPSVPSWLSGNCPSIVY